MPTSDPVTMAVGTSCSVGLDPGVSHPRTTQTTLTESGAGRIPNDQKMGNGWKASRQATDTHYNVLSVQVSWVGNTHFIGKDTVDGKRDKPNKDHIDSKGSSQNLN